MRQLFRHPSSLVLLIGILAAVPLGGRQDASPRETSEFTILSRGQAVGTESVTLTQSADGWLISSTGSLGPPFDQTTTKFQVRYGADWRPTSFVLEGTQANQLVVLSTSFSAATARTEGMYRGQAVNVTHQISPQVIVVPTGFYAGFEALASRLGAASVGSTFGLYVPPGGEIGTTVTRITPHRLTTPSGPVDLRAFDLTLANPGAPLDVEVWIDARARLARLAIPGSWLVMIRDDISSVMAREETVKRSGDQEVFIPALGFGLAATVSGPADRARRLPAVVLVAGAGRQDRDQRVAGVPVFAHVAAALADAGFIVVRYDKRGAGRSGGRTESATLADYANDALSVVQWLRKRPDVDRNRVALVGYAEGAAMTLTAGARDKRLAALCLIAAPGLTGREVTLLQQQHTLEQSNEPESSKQAKAALQTRIVDAVIKGTGWDGIGAGVRRQADTPWFRSWLLFNPATAIPKVRQPLLIVTGSLDPLFPPAQADRLETLGQARKKLPATATRKVVVPGVNHILVPATSAEEREYPSLSGVSVSPAVTSAIVDWLKAVLTSRP